MKKSLFILGLFLSVALVYAQTTPNFATQASENPTRGGGVLLWDNTNINIVPGQPGGTSTYWSVSDSWTWVADDFDADAAWIIEKVYSKGYYPEAVPTTTDKMGIVIYKNSNGQPGEEIYRNMNITVANALEPEITLPTPFQLPAPGKYWITIAAVYDRAATENSHVSGFRWYIDRGDIQIGLNYHYYQTHDIFTGYPVNEWLNASVNVKLYSSYFKIEGDPNVHFDCEPVTNLNIEYDGNCSQAEVTWNAPSAGNFQYAVFRDGVQLATVDTESFIDVTFEPTLGHTWGVRVVCDGYTPQVTKYKDFCKEPDCPQAPKNLKVEYKDCESALLNWHAPTEVLWDNVEPTSNGYKAFRCLLEAYSRIEMFADDFIIKSGETWHISEIYYGGFYTPSGQDPFSPPDYIGVEIFKDSGSDSPGVQIYENEFLTTVSGSYSNQQTLLLPEMIKLDQPGKYWIAIYGVYDALYDETEHGFWVYHHTVPIETNMYAYDESSGTWEVHGGTSMYFRLQGYKELNEFRYNVYRDGVVIAENITDLTLTDTEFNPYLQHTWAVKLVCLDGSGVSAPSLLTVQKCAESVADNSAASFTLYPNPASNEITILSEDHFNKVEVYSLMGQMVLAKVADGKTTELNVSNLVNGTYFVRIVSENGYSVMKFIKQ